VLENLGYTLSMSRLDSLHQLVRKATYHFTDKLELCEALMIVIHDNEKHCEETTEDMKMNVIVRDQWPSSVDGDTQQMNNTTRTHHLGFLMRFALSITRSCGRAVYSACKESWRHQALRAHPKKRHTFLSSSAGTSTTRGL
jgi:hypothetical protein